MIIRIFTCSNCGHKLRFGRSYCGYCRKPTNMLNRTSTYVIGAVVLGGLVYVLV